MPDETLILGPLVRHVALTSATVWVEVARPATVAVVAGDLRWEAPTFAVHGHHYAVVDATGLRPGTVVDYAVEIDGSVVWPPASTSFPPSRLATLKERRGLRIAFGSCRASASHDAAGNRAHGVDALRAYALDMAAGDPDGWPDLVLFLGDQVYADETSDEMREFIASRRDTEEPPGTELKDYEEYAHLYRLAWEEPAIRWLLSTLPSAMIFDDHDIRDDWNTSARWRRDMQATSWWQERIVAGLASYWVYQHAGNLSPEERADDEIWSQIAAAQADGRQVDFGPLLDAFAARADEHPDTYRWSYRRDIGGSRLVVVDSRAARVLREDERSLLDDAELRWLDGQLRGGVDHVLIGTSLPYLLSSGLHEFEAWNEAVGAGAWGKRLTPWGERVRRAVDLEHWAAFQRAFRDVATMVTSVADGERGEPPSTITFLSGDVHNSYVAEVDRPGPCRILQAVCSPIRNPLPWSMRKISGFSSKNIGGGVAAWLARRADVEPPPFAWKTVHGPWFDNNLATLESEGRRLWIRWEKGTVADGARPGVLAKVARRTVDRRDQQDPRLEVVQELRVD